MTLIRQKSVAKEATNNLIPHAKNNDTAVELLTRLLGETASIRMRLLAESDTSPVCSRSHSLLLITLDKILLRVGRCKPIMLMSEAEAVTLLCRIRIVLTGGIRELRRNGDDTTLLAIQSLRSLRSLLK